MEPTAAPAAAQTDAGDVSGVSRQGAAMTGETIGGGSKAAHRRCGAPKGNRNAAKYGLRMSGWPKGCPQKRDVEQWRRRLWHEVETLYGAVSVTHEGLINQAAEYDRRRVLLGRQMRLKGDDWNTEQIDANLAATTAAAERRDAIVDELLQQPKLRAAVPAPYTPRKDGDE